MKYTELEITVSRDRLEDLQNKLILMGFDSFEVCDFADLEDAVGQVFYDYIDESLLEKKNADPSVKICFDSDHLSQLSGLTAFLDKEGYSYTLTEDDSGDWENNWKKYFYPFPVGDRLYVKPTWLEAGEDAAGRRILEIDPASAFGSGTHATTRLCLEEAQKLISGGEKVLDMGCGSGILGIGALALGAGSVTAVDIDPNAARVAGENFLTNHCDPAAFKVLSGDVLSNENLRKEIGGGYSVILANIVAGVIVAMADLFYEKLAPGGSLIASGIISEREDEVAEALIAAGFVKRAARSSEDWSVLVMEKE